MIYLLQKPVRNKIRNLDPSFKTDQNFCRYFLERQAYITVK